MTISTAGWIGIAAGLALAAFDYLFVLQVVRNSLQARDPAEADRRIRPFKLLMAAGFVAFPVLGYLIANLVAG